MKDVERLLRKGVQDIEPYVPGKSLDAVKAEFGLSQVVKMASNENPLGPSPKALAAMKKELRNVHLYPEGPCTVLREELSKKLGIARDMITLSNGSDNCALLVGSAFINEGDEILMADPTFPVYKTIARIMGGRPVCIKLRDHTHDLDTMVREISEFTKLVFVSNPHNPTGTIVGKGQLDDFVASLPEHTILVLDEAYGDFVVDEDYPDGLDYVKQACNVIVLRTFSKLYGLAGIRVGYALGRGELIAALNRVREPFPVSRVAQVAAVAALGDEDFNKKVIKNNEDGKAYLYQEFEKMRVSYVPSHANFILADFARDSQDLFESLLREGVIIRPGYLWNYPTSARVTIGKMDQNRRFLTVLNKVLERSRAEPGRFTNPKSL
jgi:histidinol-phosphate aminotransferase